MYAVLGASALALVLPSPISPPALVHPAGQGTTFLSIDHSPIFPSTGLLADTKLIKEAGGFLDGPKRDVYTGSTDSMDLDSLIDSVPTSGKKGKQKEDPGPVSYTHLTLPTIRLV